MAKNTVRYHISKSGVPAACQAKKRMCPLGGDDKHFATKEEAQAEADKIFAKKYPMNKKKETLGAKFAERRRESRRNKLTLEEEQRREDIRKQADLERKAKYKSVEIPYRKKINSIEVFSGTIEVGDESSHFNADRHARAVQLEELFGVSTPVKAFVIDDGRRSKQIHEVHDTGKIRIYDVNTHKVITEFQPQPERIQDIFNEAKVDIPRNLLRTARKNRTKLDSVNTTPV